MTWIARVFRYVSPLWCGEDGKPSLRAIAAIALLYKLIENLDFVIQKWESGRELGDVSTIFFTLAGLIAALLGITAWSNMTSKKLDTESALPPNTTIKVEKAETVTSGSINGNTSKTQTDTTTRTTSDTPETEHKPSIEAKTE